MSAGNRLGELLGIDTPIVLGGFGGLSSVELTAVVSDKGGLGTHGLYGCGAERIRVSVTAWFGTRVTV